MQHPEDRAMTVTIDRYTKAVLSTIAACLLFQSVMMLDKVVEARQQATARSAEGRPADGPSPVPPTPVVIVGWDAVALERQPPLPVEVKGTQPVPVSIDTSRPLPVAVSSPVKLAYAPDQPLPVAINGVKKASGQWEAIHVHVESQQMGAPGAPRP
jgi:hypothetical protein